MAQQSLLDETAQGELSLAEWVRYYWILDPQLRSLEILKLGSQGRYEHLLGATDGQVEIPGCDGFVLDLDAAWAEIERFEAR